MSLKAGVIPGEVIVKSPAFTATPLIFAPSAAPSSR